MMNGIFPVFGLKMVPMPIQEAARAYEEGRHDGFTGPPTAALGFQWSSEAKYYIDLPLAYITGCMVIANRAFDAIRLDDQQALRAAAAKASVRIDSMSRELDAQLLGGLFKRQGLTEVPVSPVLRAQFEDGAKVARAELAKGEIPAELIDRVAAMLEERRKRAH
jgi:TRAP-type C4-dicarboxylate transport system substrate-binding protein